MEEIELESDFNHLIPEVVVEPKETNTFGDRVRRLFRVCGWRFILFLVFSQFGCKGLLMIVVKSIMLPLFRTHVDAATLQIYIMLVMIPWTIKPLIGLCSDYVLLWGYHKKGWLLMSGLIGSVSAACLFLLSRPYWAVFCFVGINFEVAVYDLLSEGKYAEFRREEKMIGSDLTTFTQALQNGGVLLGSTFVGVLSDAGLYIVLYIFTLSFCIAPLVPTLLGWMPEKHFPRGDPDIPSLREDWPFILVVFVCGLGGLTVGTLTLAIPEPLGSFVGLGVGLLFVGIILYGANNVFKDFPLITAVALYQVITSLSSPVIGSELDYFYTATPDCLADGPHFDYSYFVSYTGVVGTILSLTGTFIYYIALSKFRFRPVLLITTVLVCLAGFSDLFIVLRWNVALGIPDKWAYMAGEAVLEPLLSTLNWIPVSALIALSAPKGKEATCFAFLAGISNFSRVLSELSGSIVIRFTSSLSAAGGTAGCDFSSLWWLVLLCHISFPLVIGILATWLIPDIGQEEDGNHASE